MTTVFLPCCDFVIESIPPRLPMQYCKNCAFVIRHFVCACVIPQACTFLCNTAFIYNIKIAEIQNRIVYGEGRERERERAVSYTHLRAHET